MSILGNTKKTATLDRKNSAKLPKLTIQQQIDNNQVIERMNRKITFTKNQRYLSKTLQYVEALQNNSNGSVFRIDPMQLYFTDFEANKIYESQIKLINRSKHIQRIKITPLQKKQFVVSNVKYPVEDSGDIAPGMSVSIFVRFKPVNLHDNQDQLIVIVGDGVIRIPIKAQRQKCKGQWPSQINCGHCWVGDQQLKQINISNKGGQAIFRLEDAGPDNQKVIGAFKIWPSQIKIQKNKKNIIHVNFCPNKQGLFEQKITYISNQGQQQRITIRLKGGAYTASITLDEINNQKVSIKKYHNSLYLKYCQPGKQQTSNFKVHNHAVVPVDFLWHYQNQPNFAITQQKGKISPSQIISFTVSYTPLSRNPKSIFAYLYLYNLPKQSILNNPVSKIINGIQMIQCLKLQVKVSSKDSNIQIIPLHKRITQKIYKQRPKKTNFLIQNNSNVDRQYWITKINQDKYCTAQCQITQKSIIKSNTTQQIWFTFTINKLTQSTQKAYFMLNFDNLPAKIISIQGNVQYPDLQLFATNIQFQLLRTNSIYRKRIKIINQGQNNIQFKFINQCRFYQLDFYDFYQFQNTDFYQHKLRILCQDKECQEWIIVQPNGQKYLQFQLYTKDVQDIQLDVEMIIKDGKKYKFTVTAQVQDAYAKLSQNYIPLKQIFQGNVYNSNKFLPRQLSIQNIGNIGISYQIIPAQVEQCLINISALNGIIQVKNKKRIDLILEPQKTGTFSPIFKINYYDNIPLYPQNYGQNKDIIQIVPENRKKLFKKDQLKIEGTIRGVQTAYYIKDQSRAKKIPLKVPSDEGHSSIKISSHSYKSGSASRSLYLQSYKIVYPPLQQLNFFNCQINKVQQLQIIIQNNSQLTTEYEIYAQNFRSIEKVKTETKSIAKGMMQSQQLAFTSVMGKTFIQNRALNQAQKIYLSNNKGISIMCQPQSGILHKRQTQKIVITMFNDTSGRFKDNLVINVKDHEIKKFPINLQIKGTPVSLSRNQLGINFNNQIPLLNAGTFLVANGKSTRNIKIVNNGPKPVDIRWVMYPYGQTAQQQDYFNIQFVGAQPGSNNLVQTNWLAIKPKPLQNPPFIITPKQRILKGRQQANFLLTIQQSSICQNIKALIIGQTKMAVEIQKNKTQTTDKIQKISMQELAIIVQAEIVKPILKMDQRHANLLTIFQKFATVGNQYRTQSNNYQQKIQLKNNQRCNVSFTIDIKSNNLLNDCFQLIGTATDSPLTKLKQKALTPTINTKTKAQIQKQFTLPYDSFVQIDIELKGNTKNVQDWQNQPKIRKDGTLIINYLNGQVQNIPLVGWLYRPFLNIQMPNQQPYSNQNIIIDFGIVHVNNHQKKSIYLSNPTKSAADWTISYVKYQQTKKIIFQKQLWTDLDRQDQHITDQKKCFRLSHDSGHLLAQSIPVHYIPSTLALNNFDDKYAETHKPFKLDFIFKPENNVLYKSKFVIKVQHGISYQIILRGKGTFEQQAQIK